MKTSDNELDARIAEAGKQQFDDSVDALDAATLSRLNRGRQQALQQLSGSPQRWRQWMPATGLAAVAVLAVVMFSTPGEIDVIAAPPSDFEIVMSEENIEMLEELEFYRWLDTQELSDDGDLG